MCKLFVLRIVTWSYYHYYYYYSLRIFRWSLGDYKSLQVSWTLLSILAVLGNVVVWKVSATLPMSYSSSSLTKSLWTAPSAPTIIGINVTFMFHNFLVLWQIPSICLSFRFLWFSLFYARTVKSVGSLFSFLFSQLLIGPVFWPRVGDLFISQNPNEFCIPQDWFWFMRIPFASIIKFQFLAPFPVDHFSHRVVSGILFFLS